MLVRSWQSSGLVPAVWVFRERRTQHDPMFLEEELRKTPPFGRKKSGQADNVWKCSSIHGFGKLCTRRAGRVFCPQGQLRRLRHSGSCRLGRHVGQFCLSGSDAYASTSDGYRSGSGYFDIDRRASHSVQLKKLASLVVAHDVP